jgi:iron complex outermembrane receptor protein
MARQAGIYGIALALIITVAGGTRTWGSSRGQEDGSAPGGNLENLLTVKARVYDPQGRVVPHARVTLRPLPAGREITTRTDADGEFVLSHLEPGVYQIQVRARGFQTVTVRREFRNSVSGLAIRLQVKAVGEQIQVTSSMPELSTEQQVAGSSLAQTQTQDIASALRYLPGVSAIRRGPLNLDPVVRGLQGNQVPTFVNGGHTFAVGPARMDSGMSHVSPHEVDTVRVVKGPYALTWGPGTMSAVRVKTLQPPFPGRFTVHGRAGFNYGTNAMSSDPYASLWGGNSRVTIGLFHNTRTGRDYHAGNGDVVPGHYEVNDSRWNLGLRLSPNTLFRYTGGFEEDNNLDYPGRLLTARDFLARSHNFALHWKPKSGSLSDVSGRFYSNRLGHLMNNSGKPTAMPMAGRMPPFALKVELPAHSDTLGGAFHVALGHSAWTGQIGTDFYHLDQNADRSVSRLDNGQLLFYDIVWPGATQNDEGAYGQLVFQRGRSRVGGTVRVDGVQTSAGRLSTFFLQNTSGALNNHEVNFSAALSSSFRITDYWSVSAGVGRVVATPTILERYSDRFPSTEFQISAEFMGNPSLRPEQSLEFDMGSQIRFKGTEMEISLYHRRINDYVTVSPDPSLPRRLPLDPTLVYRYINGSARYYGGEVSIERGFGRYLNSSAGASYTWAEDLKLDEPLIGIPPLRGHIRLTLHSAGGRAALQSETVLNGSQNRVAASRFEIPTAGYAIFNLESFYQITQRWIFRVGVENLGNRYYWDHLDAMNPYIHQPIPEMGRNVRVGFEFNF